ncbi:tRNA (adenosine(37)-N6)-dimethylallyltransferase MiaA [Microbacterium sp.]|uniref:tRNA (adenosine(37)-N6)-dimethylallyltransferase MiaA n=1 Tax=Microbacterium sp. TaxID=51671 RepID=UPI00262FDA18|nr:tRNA (adenosine(37)-N6)-dimethylallyltransferase MiaA [Microbacterium sp.]
MDASADVMAEPTLWVIVGATGTGKSETSLALAEELTRRGRRAEIINADAMQLYRGMDIGTAKLPERERRGIPHHLFDVLDVTEEAAVAAYQPAARAAIADIQERGAEAILVGGSGLYVSSVIYDFQFPPRDPARRAALEAEAAEQGIGVLMARLRRVDPETAARIDPANERRVIRALEVIESGGAGHGAALPDRPLTWHPRTRILGRRMPREDLVARLDARVERMWADGLLGEVESLRAAGIERGVTARRAIGYAQALAQLAGDLSQAEAIAQTQALTRRYARRQVSWFRRYAGVHWLEPHDDATRMLDV